MQPNGAKITAGEIWLLTDSRIFGGIDSHIIELAKGLHNHQQSVRVVLLKQYQQHSQLIEKLVGEGIPYSSIDNLLDNKRTFPALVKLIKQHRPSILHAHGYKASILCKLASFFVSCPVAVTYHAGEQPKGMVAVYDFIDRYSAFISPLRFSVSPAIDKKIPSQTVVLNNFISMPEPLPNRGKHIAFAGRLSHEKAPDRFINLAKEFPQHSFVLYGEGVMRQALQLDAPDNTCLAGYKEMSEVWPQIEVLVIPSRFEGLPMVALEAMGRMIPVIAMDVGALNKLIISNQNGWLCQTEVELVNALHSWIAMTTKQRADMQDNCRETIQCHYSADKVIPDILNHYRHAI